jgi:hypothetical protein
MRTARVRLPIALALPVLLVASAGCDIVTADLNAKETAEWRKTYELEPGGRIEITNVNGVIEVLPSTGNTVEVVALKQARGGTAEAAKQVLDTIEIREEASSSRIKIETKVPRSGGLFHRNGVQVRYTVKVPASAEGDFTTTNGGIEVTGVKGRVNLTTTNGGIRARDVGGAIAASTTNGGVDVEITDVAETGVKLGCTNGGIRLRLPADAKATISASVTNGGIDADGLDNLQTRESSRRRLEADLNGGGPRVQLEGTNGGIRISAR